MTAETDSDILLLHDEAEPSCPPEMSEWKVLVVDDDDDVHRITVFALGTTLILGRRLRFFHAYDAEQTIEYLTTEKDIAVVLLDVVMEKENTGLTLVKTIREKLGMSDVRIVLRTGQPGFAPEIEVIRDYDINDYKLKSELSRNSLYATLTTAIRSYEQIHAISQNRHGLNTIIQTNQRMMGLHNLQDFARSIVSETSRLLLSEFQGFVCVRNLAPASRIRIITATGSFEKLTNQPLEAIDDFPLVSVIEQAFETRHSLFGDRFCALHFPGKMGCELVAYLATDAPLDETRKQLLAVFCTNIAISLDNTQLFDQLHDHAYNDQLLHIPNRLDFMRTVGDAILSERMDRSIAIVDIDHFSQLNDVLGHRYGDTLLKAVAARLVAQLPAGTVVARLAADTFGLLGTNETLRPEVLSALFRAPFFVEGAEQSLTATIGLARLSEIDGNGTEAVQSANIALNRAKTTARGETLYFSRQMETETRARLHLMRELRSAFDQERLFLVYQPQYDLRTKRLTGIEALLRWRAEDGNFIPPDRFIPLAESSGLIVALGAWVLRTACRDLKRLEEESLGDLRLAVNVSATQFRHPEFIRTVDQAIREAGISPRQLELEITESVAMLDADLTLVTLKDLKSREVAVAIDDFGTGFSSLKYLERFKVDRLKIDQSFIHQMIHSHGSQRIVETIIQLAQSLELSVTAEGVEQEIQAELLERIGCQEAQGYFFARPMAWRQLRSFLSPSPPTA